MSCSWIHKILKIQNKQDYLIHNTVYVHNVTDAFTTGRMSFKGGATGKNANRDQISIKLQKLYFWNYEILDISHKTKTVTLAIELKIASS